VRRDPGEGAEQAPGADPDAALRQIEEVARASVYLCSSDGDYITGAELSINGGLFA
jgi:NAD(P)-dependent dehydrogenase (short-subunit alcohol dehydrogenase family)